MRSASQHSFAIAPQCDIPRSKFTTSQTYKTAFDSGFLVPFYVDEVLPGDTFNVKVNSFARLATPIVPVMDNLYLDFHFFYVPNRLLWDHWTNMMGEQPNPGDSTDYLVPVVNSGTPGFSVGSVADYMGLPIQVPHLDVSALPFRAYNLIWNEWFRDENLQDRVPVNKGDNSESYTDYHLLRRGKRHDYFTSCLPWPQKGPGVSIPLGDRAPVYGEGPLALADTDSETWTHLRCKTAAGGLFATGITGSSDDPTMVGVVDANRGANSGLYTDLSSATAATINSLRQAFQLQRLLERDARGGTRYTELLQSHFGVQSPDSRLQRPEYLGGNTQPIQIHSVAQTSSTDSTTPQGNLAAFGVSGGSTGFSKSFVEHGLVIGLVSVRADLTYQQGVHKMFSRRSRYDFYWPALANLGEQVVTNREIFAQGNDVLDPNTSQLIDDKAFGYQERWAEYRYGVSKITGKLRSSYAQSLDVWHLSQYFSELPLLNSEFIQDRPPLERILAVTNEPQIIFDSLVSATKVRPMPMYSVPGLIDHF